MSFLNNLVNQFTHQGQGGQQQQQGGYPQQQYQQNSYGGGNQGQGQPQPPYPWVAEWDNSQDRWIFINRETGQRTHEFPSQGGYGGQDNRGYGGQQQQSYGGNSGYQQQGYGSEPQAQKQSHNGRNVALGAAAGLAGGALLMHEGEKVEERYDEDKYRVEQDFDRADNYVDRKVYDGVQNVEDFPEDAAQWTGRKVQDVEDIPQDIDRKWDNLKDDVEDVPEDIAYGAGNVVGDVDRFGDNMDNAYDDGRDQQRYDDDNNNDRW